jgi:nucleotide-binding universal stress UspA family protein
MQAKKILVPIDYSDYSEQALQWGGSLAQKYEATLVLLHVIPKGAEEVHREGASFMYPPLAYYKPMMTSSQSSSVQPLIIDLHEKACTQLRDFAANLLADLPPVQEKVTVGKPAAEILRVARDDGVDLIVMGTHGRTGVRHLLLGSVAEEVMRHAPCPVFTLRAGTTSSQPKEE